MALFKLDKILDNVSTASNVTSNNVDIRSYKGFCIHAVPTGTMNGQLEIHASLDGTNFVTISKLDIVNNSQVLVNYENAHFLYFRVKYVALGGDGRLTVYWSAKA